LVEIGAGPPAPAHTGSGSRHHTGSANPDGRRLDEEDFAAATAAFLNKLSLDGTIKHLVVVSDPRTLGEMRKHFHRDLRGKIIGEFAKDLRRRPLEEIASLIIDADAPGNGCRHKPVRSQLAQIAQSCPSGLQLSTKLN
jgi:hypothetical protein